MPENKKNKNKANFLQPPKGTHDVMPAESKWWDRVRAVTQKLADAYHFSRISTPVIEHAELFSRTVGEATDLVQKEMYTLKTRGGDFLALRPEGTAPVARAYINHGLSRTGAIQKMFYIEPMFRHEKPQAGRYRQFTQIGFEIMGNPSDPFYDAQLILIFAKLLEELKIKNVSLKINSIGCRVCRPNYKKLLQNYYRSHLKDMCRDCNERYKTNPLRLLDCKSEQCQPFKAKAPTFFDKLCVTCSRHFKGVLEYLEELGIQYALDSQLVRGLDYYSRTVFEFFAETPGERIGALPAGGRYDYLVETLGGRPTPAVGGAVSIERLVETMKAQAVTLTEKKTKKVFMIHVGDMAKKKAARIMEDLRKAGIDIDESLSRESLKAQMKMADKGDAALALLLGQKEIFEESIIVRDLRTSAQETVRLSKLVEEIKKRLK